MSANPPDNHGKPQLMATPLVCRVPAAPLPIPLLMSSSRRSVVV